MPVDIPRDPTPPRRGLPRGLVEAQQRELGDLRLLRDVLDGQEVAVFAARALGEVLQRPVGGLLDDDLEADHGRGPDGGVPRDEPDVPTRTGLIRARAYTGGRRRGMLTSRRTGS